MEIAPGIHRIQSPLGDRFVCMFVLVGDDAVLIFDTGLKDEIIHRAILQRKEPEPGQVRYIVISHADFDHTGGEGELKALTPNALLMCHELDRARLRIPA
jgi:glyoxylase-like metal-dependent hydrolase (beta-lactamase superfamily II)